VATRADAPVLGATRTEAAEGRGQATALESRDRSEETRRLGLVDAVPAARRDVAARLALAHGLQRIVELATHAQHVDMMSVLAESPGQAARADRIV
jgi:hypothetical protein